MRSAFGIDHGAWEPIAKDAKTRTEGMRAKYWHAGTPQAEKDAAKSWLDAHAHDGRGVGDNPFKKPSAPPPPSGSQRPPGGSQRPPGGSYRPPPSGSYRPPGGSQRPPGGSHWSSYWPPPGGSHRPPPESRFENPFEETKPKKNKSAKQKYKGAKFSGKGKAVLAGIAVGGAAGASLGLHRIRDDNKRARQRAYQR